VLESLGNELPITKIIRVYYYHKLLTMSLAWILRIVYPWTRKSKFPSFGLQFPSFNWVMIPAIFFNEASALKTLASLLKKSNLLGVVKVHLDLAESKSTDARAG
jgi:hypothetical protein